MKYPKPKLFNPTNKDLKRAANLVATNLTGNVQIVLPEVKIKGKKILNTEVLYISLSNRNVNDD